MSTWSGWDNLYGWPGSTAWDDPRNWDGQNGVPPNDVYPTNANGEVAAFVSAARFIGPLTGACQTRDLRAYGGAGQVAFAAQFDATSGTKVMVEELPIGVKGEVEFQGGVIGSVEVTFSGGNFGGSGAKCGPGLTLETQTFVNPSGSGETGAAQFACQVDNIQLYHEANYVQMRFLGPITGASTIRAGPTPGPVGSGRQGEGTGVNLNAANTFIGSLYAQTYSGTKVSTDPTRWTRLNARNSGAFGAPGNEIHIIGGCLSQNSYPIPWADYTLFLENHVRITPTMFNELAYYLPDERVNDGGNIKGSGANWEIRCGIDVQELSGDANIGFTDGYTYGGAAVPAPNNDNLNVGNGGTLYTRGEYPCHIFGNLSFAAGSNVRF